MSMHNEETAPGGAQIVPQALLQRADKILFVAHLALGDFTYMQACFKAFAQAYPHIKIHLWVDEVRRTYDFRQWKHLQNYVVFDWLEACPMFDRLYTKTYSPFALHSSLRQARLEQYPIVVSFGIARRDFYAQLVRRISPKGFVVSMSKRVRFYDLRKHLIYRSLDGSYPYSRQKTQHISDICADWFLQLFGLEVPLQARVPDLPVPPSWRGQAQAQLAQWGSAAKGERNHPLIFVNAFSKQKERNWPLGNAIALVQRMQNDARWKDAHFVLNAPPEASEQVRQAVRDSALPRLHVFSAQEHFFQLPAMLEQCDLIITVETSIMHFANAVRVPVVAMMRQINPEWAPIDAAQTNILYTEGFEDSLDRIPVDKVMQFLDIPMGSAPRFSPEQLRRMAN